jgi:hypothetical protein
MTELLGVCLSSSVSMLCNTTVAVQGGFLETPTRKMHTLRFLLSVILRYILQVHRLLGIGWPLIAVWGQLRTKSCLLKGDTHSSVKIAALPCRVIYQCQQDTNPLPHFYFKGLLL